MLIRFLASAAFALLAALPAESQTPHSSGQQPERRRGLFVPRMRIERPFLVPRPRLDLRDRRMPGRQPWARRFDPEARFRLHALRMDALERMLDRRNAVRLRHEERARGLAEGSLERRQDVLRRLDERRSELGMRRLERVREIRRRLEGRRLELERRAPRFHPRHRAI